jgi:hypothetical protein
MIAHRHIKRKGKSNGSGLGVAQRLKDFSVVPLVYGVCVAAEWKTGKLHLDVRVT